jgi:hypothetical protein
MKTRTEFEARWVSKQRRDSLIRSGRLGRAILVDLFNGFLIVEPVGSNLGDGEVLSSEAADYELRPVWCLSPKAKLRDARKLLGLEAESMSGSLVAAR